MEYELEPKEDFELHCDNCGAYMTDSEDFALNTDDRKICTYCADNMSRCDNCDRPFATLGTHTNIYTANEAYILGYDADGKATVDEGIICEDCADNAHMIEAQGIEEELLVFVIWRG